MDAATKAWLDDLQKAGSLSTEEMELLTKVASNPKADEFIKGSSLRQADYSRKMQEVTNLQTAHAQKETEVAKFQSDLAQWKVGAEANYQKALREREELAGKFTAATERLRTFATLHNVPDEDLEGLIPDPKVKTTVQENGPKYLTEDQLKDYFKSAVGESSMIDATALDLSYRHQELFGTPMKNVAGFMKEAMASGKGLTAFFDDKFKVAERVAALAEEGVLKRVKDAEAAVEARLRSELQISTPREGERASVLFDSSFHPKQDGSKVDAVAAATAAYHSGTYQTKLPGR